MARIIKKSLLSLGFSRAKIYSRRQAYVEQRIWKF